MAPRRPVSESLTPDQLSTLAASVADGRRATVYLREGTPSLGLAPGSSARVVSVDGSTVVIRPRGVDDELPYEADELRITKNPPLQSDPPTPKPARKKAAPAPEPATTPRSAVAKEAVDATSTKPPAPRPATPKPAAKSAAPKASPSRKSGTRKPPASVTVTIYGSPDNEWSVAVSRGARKPQRSRPVTPETVDTAVKQLGDAPSTDAVTSLLHAAREEAERRVEELSRELEAARQALAAIEGTTPAT